MSWAEVFKIEDFIDDKMRYVSSENIISVIGTDIFPSTTEKTHLDGKVMKYPGVLTVKITKDSDLHVDVYVYKNGEKMTTIQATDGSLYSAPFEFNKNDVIKITIKRTNSATSKKINNISLLGMVAFGDF